MARKLDEVLVVDVESTCWDGPPPEGEESEIVEIGLCVVDVGTLTRMSKHSILIKPERSTISSFCTELTTLTPEMFAEAGTLADACKRLKKDFSSKDRLWASWGDYDRRQFERVCQSAGVGYAVVVYSLAGAVFWYVAVRPVEEADLKSRFREAYTDYQRRVLLWIPTFGQNANPIMNPDEQENR